MWKTAVLLFIALLGSVKPRVLTDGRDPTNKVTFYDENEGNLNVYLDQVLEGATSKFGEFKLDPMALPDSENGFQQKVWFVELHGGFKTTNGRLTGLRSLRRDGDVTLNFDSSKNVATLKGTLSVNNLYISTNARAWFGAINIPFHIGTTVQYLRATANLALPLSGETFKPKATSVVIDQIGGIKPNVNNAGPINWLLEKVLGWFVNSIRQLINDKFGGLILNAINSEIGKIGTPKISY